MPRQSLKNKRFSTIAAKAGGIFSFLFFYSQLALASSVPIIESDINIISDERTVFPEARINITVDYVVEDRENFYLCGSAIKDNGVTSSFTSEETVQDPSENPVINFNPRMRTEIVFFTEVEEIFYQVKTERGCDNFSAESKNVQSTDVDVTEYLAVVDESKAIPPYGPFEWGETEQEVVAKICSDQAFVNIDNYDAICNETEWEPFFKTYAEGGGDNVDRAANERYLDSAIRNHESIFLPSENIQPLSFGSDFEVSHIEILGVPYTVEFTFSAIIPAVATQYLEKLESEGSSNAYCFDYDGKQVCEFPPVLTGIELSTRDATVNDICERLLNSLYEKYGDPNGSSGWRYVGTYLGGRCSELRYSGGDFVDMVNYPNMRKLTVNRTQPKENDGASGL